MRPYTSRLVLALILGLLSTGWRAQSASRAEPLYYPVNMTLADNVLYVSDSYSGLHVFDVSDLHAPNETLLIPLDGNRGAAVKDDIVYANDYGQLQAIRVSGDSYTVVARIGAKYKPVDDGVFGESTSGFACACSSGDGVERVPVPSPTGGSSSYATFALIGDYMYRVDEGDLVTYNVSTPAKPKEIARTHVGWDIETLYPTEDYLFIGGTRGMFIFDRANPKAPVQLSQIEHARACDPVVVSGSTAYVTLRGSSWCGGTNDELLCVNIEEPSTPTIVGVKPVATPWGLVAKNEHLYISNGEHGYSLLDVSDPAQPSGITGWGDWPTRDFIWSENTLFVLGEHDLRIFDVTDPAAPVLLSKIEAPAS